MNVFEWQARNSFNIYLENCCKTLNIDLNYNESSLKEAYHKKVLLCHPDKGGKTEDFIKVNEAYKFLSSILSDEPKVFKLNESSLKDFDTNNIINNNIKKKYKQKPKNVIYKLDIELKDVYFGLKKKINLKRNRICKKCLENNSLFSFEPSFNCEECKGKKYSSQIKEVQLIIKPGTYDGCKVIFKGDGEEYVGYEPGDVIFEIAVKENKSYIRKGSDLFINKSISLKESLGTDNIPICLFDTDKFYVNKNKKIINPGDTKTIIGKGFPFFNNNSRRGNLHIKFNVVFPLKLNNEQKAIIKDVLDNNYNHYLKKNENNKVNISCINKKNNNNNKNVKNNNTAINKKGEINKPIKKNKSFIFNLGDKKKDDKTILQKNKIESNKSFDKNENLNRNINNILGTNCKNDNNNFEGVEIFDLNDFSDALLNKEYLCETQE